MSTQEKIDKIIHEEFFDYNGRVMTSLFYQHAEMRAQYGDEMFLKFLEKCQNDNPRPIYEPPTFVNDLINK